MPFQPGQSGNPSGRAKAKPFRDALNLALLDGAEEKPRKKTKLDSVVGALVVNAIKGDTPAIKEIADRLDGKVPQAIVGDADEAPINIVISADDANL